MNSRGGALGDIPTVGLEYRVSLRAEATAGPPVSTVTVSDWHFTYLSQSCHAPTGHGVRYRLGTLVYTSSVL